MAVIHKLYGRMYELVMELAPSPQADILEIGCEDCSFIRFLRDNGYRAIGVDRRIPESARDLLDSRVVFQTDIRYAKDLPFEGFDLVLANMVMSNGAAQAENLISGFLGSVAAALLKAGLPHVAGMSPDEIITGLSDATTSLTCDTVLREAHKYLRPSCHLIACENHPDKLGFLESQAAELGYRVIRYLPQEAILQKC